MKKRWMGIEEVMERYGFGSSCPERSTDSRLGNDEQTTAREREKEKNKTSYAG